METNNGFRVYKTTSKIKIARAYGFSDERPLVSRIKKNLHKLTDEQLLQLGEFEGHGNLLPMQVQVIVENLLGNPEDPKVLFSFTF